MPSLRLEFCCCQVDNCPGLGHEAKGSSQWGTDAYDFGPQQFGSSTQPNGDAHGIADGDPEGLRMICQYLWNCLGRMCRVDPRVSQCWGWFLMSAHGLAAFSCMFQTLQALMKFYSVACNMIVALLKNNGVCLLSLLEDVFTRKHQGLSSPIIPKSMGQGRGNEHGWSCDLS